jgi:class 3 adenylate cyclase
MGGKVAKKLGDGLMALFGYPVAQENDINHHLDMGIIEGMAELADAG